ncbi:MAG: hypothetical protein HUU02_02040 [Bacteroidetes bacterium]|nr:hypothetical protein [Bacteroidota bacterium]
MTANAHTIIPDNESHCVWMDAGLVNYKLCTCRYECETCPFDSVMREQHQTFAARAAQQSGAYLPEVQHTAAAAPPEAEDAVSRLLAPFRTLSFPADRSYYTDHTWMRSLPDGTVTVGVDAFLAQLIYPVAGIATIHPPAHIGRGEPFAWLLRDSGTFAVRCNQQGSAVRVNARLTDHPSLLTADPYGEGWLITISGASGSADNADGCTAGEFAPFILRETGELESELRRNKRSVGTTMYDGGVRIDNIEKFIGEKRYTRFVSRLLRPH